ncbi:ankyrin repeat domain-containing protein [Legionella drancourtii]|uniref:Uncharacterized protein n=1 Tax=Legionella drancourtii LLAP12 TaxID=658187 RepID=G9ENV6_9GAMM|nr:ankyrin repeat domain-containing protein [Legionella drancourtii]EHL31028.1 hypothetical protein LDG_6934 [Legionella drancourtii LLAP12]
MQHFWDAVDIIYQGGSPEKFSEAMHGIDINCQDGSGWTLLHYAVSANDVGIAKFLLEKGADANIHDAALKIPLQYVDEKDSSMYRLLSPETEKSINVPPLPITDESGFKPLHTRQKMETPKPDFSQQKDIPDSAMMNISMQILGGFMAAVGCAAVAVAFILLNAATLGTAGLVVSGVGMASILVGIGLFATGTYKNRQPIANESLADRVGHEPLLL